MTNQYYKDIELLREAYTAFKKRDMADSVLADEHVNHRVC